MPDPAHCPLEQAVSDFHQAVHDLALAVAEGTDNQLDDILIGAILSQFDKDDSERLVVYLLQQMTHLVQRGL